MLILEIDNRNIVGKWINCVSWKIERKVNFESEKFSLFEKFRIVQRNFRKVRRMEIVKKKKKIRDRFRFKKK